jgi:hypothetical protein
VAVFAGACRQLPDALVQAHPVKQTLEHAGKHHERLSRVSAARGSIYATSTSFKTIPMILDFVNIIN